MPAFGSKRVPLVTAPAATTPPVTQVAAQTPARPAPLAPPTSVTQYAPAVVAAPPARNVGFGRRPVIIASAPVAAPAPAVPAAPAAAPTTPAASPAAPATSFGRAPPAAAPARTAPVGQRPRQDGHALPVVSLDAVNGDGDDHQFEPINAGQVRYEPLSRLSPPTGAAVPASMAMETRRALLRLQAKVGDIDTWLCERLRWTREQAAHYLSAEQADAVAMCLDSAETGDGTIVADATGFGKGRILAATMRAVVLDGRIGIFLTEKDALFSDFWRDIVDIDSDDVIGQPFVLNDDVAIVHDVTGETVFKPTKKSVLKEVLATRTLPAGSRMLMATYTQFNRPGRKVELLHELAPGAHIEADEAHNFVNVDSATSQALRQAITLSGSSAYSSATFARHVDNLGSYTSVYPWLSRVGEMETLSLAARQALAEESTRIASRLGRLIRREHDLTNVRLEVSYDDERSAMHERLANELAPVLTAMSELSEAVEALVSERNAENVETLENLEPGERKAAKESWTAATFGGRMSVLVDAFLTGLLVEHSSEQCIEALRAGRKPVVVLDSTMETLMRDLQDGVDDDITDRPPTFREALLTTCQRILRVHVTRNRVREAVELSAADSLELPALLETALRLADQFPDLPLSPLDNIREAVEAEGRRLFEAGDIAFPWTMGEISGRNLRVNDGRYESMPKIGRTQTVAAFNSGGFDGILLTRSGSTGISLHASPKTPDKRQRHMIEVRLPRNPNERIQMLGRVSRRGMISEPLYTTLCTRLPSHIYQLAIQNAKMVEASACLTGSGRNGLRLDIPDMLNLTGNEVAYDILAENQNLAARLKIFMGKDAKEADRELYFVKSIYKRMPLLPQRDQALLGEAMTNAYRTRVREIGTRENGVLDGEWTPVARALFEPGDGTGDALDGGDVYVTTLQSQREVNPLRRADIGELCQPLPDLVAWVETIARRWPALLERALPNHGHFSGVEQALAATTDNPVKRLARRLQGMRAFLDVFEPGMAALLPDEDGLPARAIITKLHLPPVARATVFRDYELDYVIPGEERERHVSLETMLRSNNRLRLSPNDTEAVMQACDQAPTGIQGVQRMVFDGNPLRAILAAERMGIVTRTRYQDAGRPRQALLIPRQMERTLADIPGRMTRADLAGQVMRAGGVLRAPMADGESVQLTVASGTLMVKMPRAKRALRETMTPGMRALVGESDASFYRLPLSAAEAVVRELNQQRAVYFDRRGRTKLGELLAEERRLQTPTLAA